MSASSSNPPCCPPGSWPMLTSKDSTDAAFDPKGRVEIIKTNDGNDLKIYTVSPSPTDAPPKASIIVVQDVYSIRLFHEKSTSVGRIPAICDALAQEGFVVVLPDLFEEDPIDLAFHPPQQDETWTTQNLFGIEGVPGWFGKNNLAAHEGQLVACRDFLTAQHAELPIGALGFCYGTWLMTKAFVADIVPFKTLVGCHPATILETAVHGGDEVKLLQEASQKGAPVLFLCAGNDSDVFHAPDKPGRVALEASGGRVVDFADMVHGWVARGDTTDEKVRGDVEKAMSLVVDFFKTKLAAK